jgi:maltose O-acetyltransferase
MPSDKQRMLAGQNYRPDDPGLQAEMATTLARLGRYNTSHDLTAEARQAMLAERLCAGAFLNFNVVILDVVEVTIAERAQIGPAVQIYAADHPRDAATRRSGAEFGRPVRIGADGWIGGGAILLPGVTIGDAAVIGAGSVVTRDLSPGATVLGNPARARGG